VENVVKAIVSENLVDFTDMPLLNIIRMGVRKPEKSFGKMTYDRVFV
jgi:hypothetical protein